MGRGHTSGQRESKPLSSSKTRVGLGLRRRRRRRRRRFRGGRPTATKPLSPADNCAACQTVLVRAGTAPIIRHEFRDPVGLRLRLTRFPNGRGRSRVPVGCTQRTRTLYRHERKHILSGSRAPLTAPRQTAVGRTRLVAIERVATARARRGGRRFTGGQ